jgi:hypothetical protein
MAYGTKGGMRCATTRHYIQLPVDRLMLAFLLGENLWPRPGRFIAVCGLFVGVHM